MLRRMVGIMHGGQRTYPREPGWVILVQIGDPEWFKLWLAHDGQSRADTVMTMKEDESYLALLRRRWAGYVCADLCRVQ